MRVDVSQLVMKVEEAAQAAGAAAGWPVAGQHELVELQVRRRAGPVQKARPGQERHDLTWRGRLVAPLVRGLVLSGAAAVVGSSRCPPTAQCTVRARACRGVPASDPLALRTREPGAPALGWRLKTRWAPERSAARLAKAGTPQGQLVAAAAASQASRLSATRRMARPDSGGDARLLPSWPPPPSCLPFALWAPDVAAVRANGCG